MVSPLYGGELPGPWRESVTMHVRIACFLLGWLALGLAWAADPVVSGVQACQRAGTKLVDISYDVVDEDSVTVSVGIAISSDGGATWTVPCTHCTGDIGPGRTPGTGRSIIWDAGADWNGQWSDHMRVEVSADDAYTVPVGDYAVIDVSAGPSAPSYPVSYMLGFSPGSGWSDEYKTTRIVLRRLPGEPPYVFTMGSPPAEVGRDPQNTTNEAQRQVTLTQALYVGVFEVTQQQWERVMGTWPSYHWNESVRHGRPVEQVSYNDIRGSSAGSGWPANSAVDADSFIGRLRARTNPPLAGLDLPTEAQWEFACRAGTTTALNNGTNLTATTEDTNMSLLGRYFYTGGWGEAQDAGLENATAKVGTYLANAWGLFDMHGNVMEWCLDWWEQPYRPPPTVTDPRGPAWYLNRVIRGGHFHNNAKGCRSALRSSASPDYPRNYTGFRLALPVAQ